MRSFLKSEQAGFRKNHRTSDHIIIVDKYVLNSKNGSKLFACFIDLKNVFDTVGMMVCFINYKKQESMESYIMS